MESNKQSYHEYAAIVIGRYLAEIRGHMPGVHPSSPETPGYARRARRKNESPASPDSAKAQRAMLVGLHSPKDIEPLHRLRVAVRSLRNTLWVFKKIFLQEKLKRWQNVLRGFGKASGRSRALDTFIAYLLDFHSRSPARAKSGQNKNLAELIAQLQAKRHDLEKDVKDAISVIGRNKVLDQIEQEIQHARREVKHARGKLVRIGRKKIGRRVKELLSYEPFVCQPKKVHELHQLRIAAKHLRYTLEDLRGLYGKDVDQAIQAAKAIQDDLGDFHDFDERQRLLKEFLKNRGQGLCDPILEDLKRELIRAGDAAYRDFVRVWSKCRRNKIWKNLP